MSIYNESEKYIRESVNSMLSQTMRDFELIIVVDNPERRDVEGILKSFKDNRIVISYNEKNIGLALSMNKGAKISRSDIIVRMDADDIAEPSRLGKLYEKMMSGEYDLVFSDYSYIDGESMTVDRISGIQNTLENNLNKTIQIACMIHHPTVMFTKDIFFKAGEYRNFPCTQDLDLWLRMAENGCRFGFIKDKLLKYRLNPVGVSSQKWHQQHLTTMYIYELSVQRIKRGVDDYSLDNYKLYLEKWGCGDKKRLNRFRRCYDLLDKAQKCMIRGERMKAILLRAQVFVTSREYRANYLRMRYKKSLLK